ncbi:MAG: hypothetical protein QGH45_18130 [Myxococcota bacterium]|jgi:hypothetical protein|nr:hypothetical protein [Myxococcota bacterium]
MSRVAAGDVPPESLFYVARDWIVVRIGLAEHRHPGLVFVDNGPTFEEAIARQGYDRLFIDRFAREFGHCTPEGNRLIAANVAAAIADQLLAGE